jgi:hypothetical protein
MNETERLREENKKLKDKLVEVAIELLSFREGIRQGNHSGVKKI